MSVIEEEVSSTLMAAISASTMTTWNDVQEATTGNNDLQLLMEMIEEGFPKSATEMLHQSDNTFGPPMVLLHCHIPPPLRKACLTALQAALHGTSAMIARAEQSIFWPGITAAINQTRDSCSHSMRMSPSQAKLPPTRPVLSPLSRGSTFVRTTLVTLVTDT